MKTITINTDGLNEAIFQAQNFEWTGWRRPIFVQEFNSYEEVFESNGDITMSLSFGGWLSNNSWQPGALELAGIEPWNCEDEDCQHDGDCFIDEIRDYILEKIKSGFEDYFSQAQFDNQYRDKEHQIAIPEFEIDFE